MKESQFPTARKAGLVIQEMPGEVLVYDLDTNKAHCLNETAAFVWKSCDGNTSISDIAGILASQTGKNVKEDLIWLAIDQLNENRLLEQEIASGFSGQSRREAIKKIGMASMIALPIIASLVAPPSVLAVGSCACVVPGDCGATVGCPSTTNCNGSGLCAP
jgi:hypothetical protein